MPDEQRILTFDPTVLLDAEAEVLARTGRAEVADLGGAASPVVRAGFLRHVLLCLPAPHDPWPVRLPGVRIRGARIEGMLDLADAPGHPKRVSLRSLSRPAKSAHRWTLPTRVSPAYLCVTAAFAKYGHAVFGSRLI